MRKKNPLAQEDPCAKRAPPSTPAPGRSMSQTRLALLPVLLLATARPAAAADQLVAFDETFTIVQQGDGGLEPYPHRIDPKPTEPASWVTPVNYSKGTAYLYLEVLKKP